MNNIILWKQFIDRIEPHYLKARRGSRPIPLGTMLSAHMLQHFFNYSDPAMEEALYEVPLYCKIIDIDLAVDTVPDETTICKFHHLLERHGLVNTFLSEINAHLEACGLLLRQGRVVDATLIAAPPSTRNKTCSRDPEMGSTRKGKQWCFGMKAHIGVDADSGIVRSIVGTAAKVGDAKVMAELLHGKAVTW